MTDSLQPHIQADNQEDAQSTEPQLLGTALRAKLAAILDPLAQQALGQDHLR